MIRNGFGISTCVVVGVIFIFIFNTGCGVLSYSFFFLFCLYQSISDSEIGRWNGFGSLGVPARVRTIPKRKAGGGRGHVVSQKEALIHYANLPKWGAESEHQRKGLKNELNKLPYF